jgi:hypothetical protein
VFACARGAVTGFGQQHGQCFHPGKTAELVVAVQMSVVSVSVIVQASEHDRATRTTTGRSGKCMPEERSIRRQSINVGRYGRHIAVTPQCGAKVVGNDENNIFFSGRQAKVCQQGKRQPKSFPKMYQKMVLPCVF